MCTNRFGILQALFVPHLFEQEPPQSISVSVPFLNPSEQDAEDAEEEVEVDEEVEVAVLPVPELLFAFVFAEFIPISA